MVEDLDTFVLRTVVNWHNSRLEVLLVTVARTWGSAPRQPGSLMAINERGEIAGSISGGCLEDDLIQKVRDAGVITLCVGPAPAFLRYGISAEEAHRYGLPCGGTIELVVERITLKSHIDELLQACLERRSIERMLDLRTGHATLYPSARQVMPRITDTHFSCWFGPQARLILIGAGDLSRYVCQIALSLGFDVVVCDPREEYYMSWSLDTIQVSREMPDDLIQKLCPDSRTAVVTLTHDPKLDDLALIDALATQAFYIGAIGSRRNNAQRRSRLRAYFGLTDIQLQALHGPAGLYIGSKTPAEIALSIMAEVVAAKNGVLTSSTMSVAQGKAATES